MCKEHKILDFIEEFNKKCFDVFFKISIIDVLS